MSLFNYDNISWNLPLMFCHDEIILAIADLLKDFDVKRPILHAYGAPTTAWSGGRTSSIRFYDNAWMDSHLNKIIDSGFIPTFTFTKPFVRKDDLNDKRANWFLDWGVEHDCEFIISSDNLYNHIKEKYPTAKLVCSILQGKMEFHRINNRNFHHADSELEFYNDKIDKYDRVVVRPEYVKTKLVKDLPRIKDVGKFEVLLNETCVPNCRRTIACYTDMDKGFGNDRRHNKVCSREDFEKRHDAKTSFGFTLMVSKEDVDNLINNCGVKHLKVQGRHYNCAYLYNLILYYVFNGAGNFQAVYDYVLKRAKYHKMSKTLMPYEQNVVFDQFCMEEMSIKHI